MSVHRLCHSLSVAALLLAAASAALAGPPWISIEYPINPHHPMTRGDAFAFVRTYHHMELRSVRLEATAEGVVNGRRKSIELDLVTTPHAGVNILRRQWPAEGTWVLAIHMMNEEGDKGGARASALVALAADATIARVQVPTLTRVELDREALEEGWTIPRAARPDEVEAMLRNQVALSRTAQNLGIAEPRTTETLAAGLGLAGAVPLGLLVLVGWARGRGRRSR